ncbi:MAG: helix-turn-helix domain-containing protein [Candidatus Hodarchaeales archaeon]|jgi:predicted DNA binding protein
MLYNYLLEIQVLGLYTNFSRENPQLEILLWCNYNNDILEVRGEEKDLKIAQSELQTSLGNILKIYPESSSMQLILKRCRCSDSSISQILERYDCLELPPVRYFNGSMILNLIITSESSKLIVEDIENEIPNAKVRVLKLAPIKKLENPYPLYLPLDELKQIITPRQLEAVTVALNRGYYKIPKQNYLEALAEDMSIKRRTYEDHLRKAENKIMEYVIPALMLS